jgi:hypothetical protein
MSKSPSALPAFSYNWVGGDIHGLSNLAGVLYGFASRSDEPVSALNHTVNRLLENWKGRAADGFRRDFGQDATDVNWLTSRANSIGDVVDGLAGHLAKIESWLESQAEQGVRAKYITIDGAGKLGLPRGTSDPRVQNFLQQFNQCREQALMAAKAARKAAAGKLAPEYETLSAGLKNYRDNHTNLLSKNEINALSSSLAGLDASFAKADDPLKSTHPPGAHKKSVMKDFVAGAVTVNAGIIGGIIGTIVEPGGGTAAGAIGGAGLGTAIGAPIGQWVGSIFD